MNNSYNPGKGNVLRRFLQKIQVLKRACTYLRLPDNAKVADTVFFIIEPKYQQAGLADRLKAIVNTYYLSKINGLNFKLYFRDPFELRKYLLPNIVNWECELSDLDKSLLSSKLSVYRAEYPLPILKHGYQYHYLWYWGTDMIRLQSCRENEGNSELTWHSTFKSCFDELFKPSAFLTALLDTVPLNAKQYVSVHFRFVNLLGNFEGNTKRFPVLNEEHQQEIIQKCITQLNRISKDNRGLPVYVFSDSIKFLKICDNLGYYRIAGDNLGNVAHANGSDAEDKTMLDFFTIARSKKVYSVVMRGMYSGVFSQYAALIGGAEFERISE